MLNKVFEYTGGANLLGELLISAAIYRAFHLISRAADKYLLPSAKKLFGGAKSPVIVALVDSAVKPVVWFIRFVGLFLAVNNIPFSAPIRLFLNGIMGKIFRIMLILFISKSVQNFVVNIPRHFEDIEKRFGGINKTILSFFTKLGKAVIIALTAVIIINELGYDITGLIAGLGLSGLTFALAAQDTASNLVSGIVILMDKPFAIGDWISVGNMEGIVEEMNFRSCRIRTFDNALISVPNNKISSDSVTNWTNRQLRKATINIGLLYSTSKEQLQNICRQIKAGLEEQKDIKPDSILVRFEGFAASSLDVVVVYHTYLVSAGAYMDLKAQVQYMIMDIVKANGTDFAFNSLTVYNG